MERLRLAQILEVGKRHGRKAAAGITLLAASAFAACGEGESNGEVKTSPTLLFDTPVPIRTIEPTIEATGVLPTEPPPSVAPTEIPTVVPTLEPTIIATIIPKLTEIPVPVFTQLPSEPPPPEPKPTPVPPYVPPPESPPPPKATPIPPPPEPKPAPTVETAEGPNYEWASQLTDMINAERVKKGLNSLVVHQAIVSSSFEYAEFLVKNVPGTFGHDLDGLTAQERAEKYGYIGLSVSESLAVGLPVDQIMQAWINSEGHYTNMMRSDYDEIGLGCYQGNHRYNDGHTDFMVVCAAEFGTSSL